MVQSSGCCQHDTVHNCNYQCSIQVWLVLVFKNCDCGYHPNGSNTELDYSWHGWILFWHSCCHTLYSKRVIQVYDMAWFTQGARTICFWFLEILKLCQSLMVYFLLLAYMSSSCCNLPARGWEMWSRIRVFIYHCVNSGMFSHDLCCLSRSFLLSCARETCKTLSCATGKIRLIIIICTWGCH